MARKMSERELARLSALLAKFSEETTPGEGQLRDAIAYVRFMVEASMGVEQ